LLTILKNKFFTNIAIRNEYSLFLLDKNGSLFDLTYLKIQANEKEEKYCCFAYFTDKCNNSGKFH
jgi:hypothetical protein